jgi:D-hydroxyproline dehydrogenase subunit alpha
MMGRLRRLVGIVGSGPSGAAVSEVLVAAGVPHDLYDEAGRSGGNIHRQRFDSPLSAFERSDDIRRMNCNSAVLAVTPDREIEYDRGSGPELGAYEAVFICTGAYDVQLPTRRRFPNWSSAGALQALLKGQGLVPRGKVVLSGAGPFLYIVGSELVRAGADVCAIVDMVPQYRYTALMAHSLALPSVVVQFLRALAVLYRNGIALHFGSHIQAADQQNAHLANGRTVSFDHLGVSDCFAPQTQLPRTAGCEQLYSARGKYFFTRTDRDGRTTQPGIFVCGEGQGIRGASFARLSGLIAALAWLGDTGRAQPRGFLKARLDRQAEKVQRFAEALERIMYTPVHDIADDAWICACERVEVRRVREAIAVGLVDLSSIKIITRCGMGSCQGRYCEPLICRLFAEANKEPVAPFSQRLLARPVCAGDLANG